MSFKPVLVFRNDYSIERNISIIREKREKNAEKLNFLFSRLRQFKGGDIGISELVNFLNSENPKDYLIGEFLENQRIGSVNVKPEKLEEILEIPKYTDLLEAREYILENSINLELYYSASHKKFEVPTISKTEKEEIIKANSVYAENEDVLKMVRNLEGFCNVINHYAEFGYSTQLRVFPSWILKLIHIEDVMVKGRSMQNCKVNYHHVCNE